MLPLARVKGLGRPPDEVTEGAVELSATLTVREAVRRGRDAGRGGQATVGSVAADEVFKPVQN